MAIAFQTETHSTSITSSSTCTVTKPSGTTDGDLLVATIIFYNNNTVSSVPSGWSLLKGMTDLDAFKKYTYYKVASSEGASWNWGFSDSSDWVYMCARFDGMSPVTPISVSNGNYVVNSGTPSWSCGITQPYTDSMLIMIIASNEDTNRGVSGYAVASDNPTWTERIDQNISTNKCIALATAPRSTASATGNASATLGTSDGTEDSYCTLFAINRIYNFTSTLTDTTTITDSINESLSFSLTDTTTPSDSLSASYNEYTNASKSSSSWSNQSKST